MKLPHKTDLHLWQTHLDDPSYQTQALALLSIDEKTRAAKFRFDIHRQRFINARAALRSILALYLAIKPEDLVFSYTEQGKPYLMQQNLTFNLTHSHELALYAITYETQIGIDLEKIQASYSEEVAKRFFSAEEYAEFSNLANDQKTSAFYRLWTEKEAVVKALGKGLGFALSSFSTPLNSQQKEVVFKENPPPEKWYVENLNIFQNYQASYAANTRITEILQWEWSFRDGII